MYNVSIKGLVSIASFSSHRATSGTRSRAQLTVENVFGKATIEHPTQMPQPAHPSNLQSLEQ